MVINNIYQITGIESERSAIFSADLFFNQVHRDSFRTNSQLIALCSNNIFMEAVLLESPDLYCCLTEFKILAPSKQKKVLEAVDRFLSRMSTKATPRGLLSSVYIEGLDSVENQIEGNELPEATYKFVDVDYTWFLKLLRQLEDNIEIFDKLRVTWNPTVIRQGRYYIKLVSTAWDRVEDSSSKIDNRKNDHISLIRYTKVLEYIKKSTSHSISILELKQNIRRRYSKFSSDNITIFLNHLVRKEILITNLRPSLTSYSLLKDLLCKLDSIDTSQSIIYKEKLSQIQCIIDEYRSLPIGEGIQCYKKLRNRMDKIVHSKKFVKVDLYKNKKELQGCSSMMKNITEAINLLAQYSQIPQEFSAINEYLKLFVDRYGVCRKVALTDVMKPVSGLGSPYSQTQFNMEQRHSWKFLKRRLAPFLVAVFAEGKDELQLTSLVEKCEKTYAPNLLADSFELIVQSNPKSKELSCLFQPNTGSDQQGKIVNRFNGGHDVSRFSFSDLNYEVVELSELLYDSNVMNVRGNGAKDLSGAGLELCIGMSPSKCLKNLNIDEICVAAIPSNQNRCRFIFTKKGSDKEIRFVISSMVNYKQEGLFSYISRFLLEASAMSFGTNIPPFFISQIMSIHDIPVIPRIMHKKIIILPKIWNLREQFLGDSDRGVTTLQKLEEYMHKWKVPRFVRFQEEDNYIVLDLERVEHRRYLLRELKRKDYLQLLEIPFEFMTNTTTELVLGFRKNSEQVKNEYFQTGLGRLNLLSCVHGNLNRFNGLLDEWVYFKIYNLGVAKREFLVSFLNNFADRCLKFDMCEDFHYVIYADPYEHIRVRFKVKNLVHSQTDTIIKFIKYFSSELREYFGDVRVDISEYEMELERYGGVSNFLIAQHIFTFDSQFCLKFLSTEQDQSEVNRIVSLQSFANEIGISDEALYEFCQSFDTPQMKKKYGKAIHAKLNGITLPKRKVENSRMIPLAKKFSFNDSFARSTCMKSILHMHCNRMLLNHEEEEKDMFFLQKYLKLQLRKGL